MTGIVSYGVYIPKQRIKVADIAAFYSKQGDEVSSALRVSEKAIAAVDEDAATLAIEASYAALQDGKIDSLDIEAITVGSESHPYVVKPTATIVGEALGIGNNYLACDLEFACKAGTTGMQFLWALVETGKVKLALAIGSDVAQAKPGDVLEFTAGAAAGAFVLGKKNTIADIIDFTSFTSNTPDFWRRDGQRYPTHAGRFTGEPAYFAHVLGASKNLLDRHKKKASDFTYAVFHMPNGKFPGEVAKRLGFTKEQLQAGFVVDRIGNPYSASSLVGLAAVLDIAKPNQTIFFCSYGSGAGSDAFMLKTTKHIISFQKQIKEKVADQINNKIYIDYNEAIKIANARKSL